MKRYVALVAFAVGCGKSPTGQPDAARATDSAVGDGSPDAADNATYSAFAIVGGLDRLRITKTVGGTCFEIQLVSPDSNGMGLTLPTNWGFEHARAMQPAAACDPRYLGPIANMFAASSQMGTIAWSGTGTPQTVTSVQATLTFVTNPAWCPPTQAFAAASIQVQ